MIIIGAGNHFLDIEEIAIRCGLRDLTVYDDDPAIGIAPTGDLKGQLLVGVNDPSLRRQIVKRFSCLRGANPLVDPSALIGSDVVMGQGTVIGPMASLLHSVTLKDHVHVNTGAQMVRTIIGAYTTICPGATICGNVDIGEACLVGASATICERTTIGNDVRIGAGAIIPPYSNVPNGVTVTGVWKE